MTHYHPEDRPEPSEQPIRARVPDRVSAGAFSTGVIVMTAQSEFILDFVQNLGRPHQIVARVVMPHHVLPQLVDALQRNIELYKNRWGELPTLGVPKPAAPQNPNPFGNEMGVSESSPPPSGPAAAAAEQPATPRAQNAHQPSGPAAAGPGAGSGSVGPVDPPASEMGEAAPQSAGDAGGNQPAGTRQASVQEVYDDLKVRDEFLSGAYANAVMIGHGPHEFSFDFITNFYPHSAVSSRVFLAAGQIPRLYESLKGTWEQLRARIQPPPGRQPPQPPPAGDDPPFA